MESLVSARRVNSDELEQRVKKMYSDVAINPMGEYHFEMGRKLAEKLGYEKKDLDTVPDACIESFAGVGYFLDLADLKEGNAVLDLGSGSGMDSFLAALKVGKKGLVTGIDMTDEQLRKSAGIARDYNFLNVEFVKGYIDQLPFAAEAFDIVISNGVINLSVEKEKVFKEISRVLKRGGKMIIADIVSEHQLPETITCDSALWASCIGGASQEDAYKSAVENAGLKVIFVRNNTEYSFISKSALNASQKYGVKSVSLVAEKLN